MAVITIYTQPGCFYCSRAMALLRKKGLDFDEINAPHGSPARREAQARSGGGTTMPQIFIDHRHVGGCDDLMLAEQSGDLDSWLAAGTATAAE